MNHQVILNRLAWGCVFGHAYTGRELGFGGCGSGVVKRFGLGDGVFGCSDVVLQDRRDRFWLVKRKMDIGLKAARVMRWVPFVRAVFLCNTVAFGWPKEESDVDVCVVVKKGRLWIARMLVTLLLQVFGMRRRGTHVSNKVCLSFYVVDESLDFSHIAIKDDVYLAYWIDGLIPLYDPSNLLHEMKKQNEWAREFVGSFRKCSLSVKYSVRDRGLQKKVKRLFERAWEGAYGDLIEQQARGLQKSKMARNRVTVQNVDDSRVVVSDDMLKFHENDRREEYRGEFGKAVKVVGW